MLRDLGQFLVDKAGTPGVDPLVADAYRTFGLDLMTTARFIVRQPLPEPPVSLATQTPIRAALLMGVLLCWMGSLATNPEISEALREQLQRTYADGEAMADAAEGDPDPFHVRTPNSAAVEGGITAI